MPDEYSYIEHPFAPVWNEKSRIFILGTMPSPASRRHGFYYGHPGNRFWSTLARILNVPVPQKDRNSQEEFLLTHRIAVWDVLRSCRIQGASDGSICEPVPNAFRSIIEQSDIGAVFTTGGEATRLFNSLAAAEAGMTARYLPSTSPANVCWDKRHYYDVWKEEITRSLLT